MINKKIKITIFVLAFILSGVLSTNAQNGTYNAKIGDKTNYSINTFLMSGQSKVLASEAWADGNSSTLTLRAGFNFTVELCGYEAVPNTNDTIPEVIFTLNGNSTSCGKNTLPDIFSAETYIEPVYNTTYYQNLVTKSSTKYQLSGDNFTTNSSYSYVSTGGSYGWDLITLNTKTGWLVRIEGKDFYQGSMDNHIVISEVPTKSSKSSPGFEISTILGSLAIITSVIILKRKKNTF